MTFIYLATLSLSCSMQTCKLLVVACGIWLSGQGWNLGPGHQECRVLATGPPGNSQ